MNEYQQRYGNAPRKQTRYQWDNPNGSARVELVCRCGTTVFVSLYNDYYDNRFGFDVPEGWYVEVEDRDIESYGKSGEEMSFRIMRPTVVRCPQHRQIV